MAAEQFTVMNVYEQAKRLDPDGRPAKIAEILNRIDSIMADAPATEANDQNSHVNTVRYGLPIPSIRKINSGAELTVSETKQLREELMLLEDWVRIDEKIVEMQSDRKKFRYNEVIAHLEGMKHAFQDNFWYGNAAEIGEINGVATRYNSKAMPNVTSAGGSAALSSVWLFEWGETKVGLLYPRGSVAGIEDEDKGKTTIWKDDKPYDAFVNKIRMQTGISVIDERSLRRIGDVDSTATQTTGSLRDPLVIAQLIAQMNELPMAGQGAKMYVNRQLKAQMDIMAYDRSNAAFNYTEVQGKVITTFFGMPIRLAEGIMSTEAALAS